MFSQWTFGRRIAAGYAVSFVLLLAVAAVADRGLAAMTDAADWVTHTHKVLERLAQVGRLMVDVETGDRGFVITGDETFLEPYTKALPQLDAALEELRTFTADNPAQQERLARLAPVVAARSAHARQAIELRRGTDADAAARFVGEGGGKKLMDQARAILAEMDVAEHELLAARSADAARSAAIARFAILAGTLIALAVLIVTGTLITRSLTAQIGAAVERVRSSAAELQSAAAEQAAASTEQRASTTEASTTLKELSATSRQIADSARRVSQTAEETARTGAAGEQIVGRAAETVGATKRQVDLVVGHMLELSKKAQLVGTVLDLINELADQTNILAINATIESAGAGEAGKRFAVVAEEVRKLADRVGGSTREVRTLVEDIRSSAHTTVMATEDGSKSVDASARQLAEVVETFRRISERAGTGAEASREIELGTRQQVVAVEQVGTALQGIGQAAGQNEVSTRQIADTASELLRQSDNLRRITVRRAAAKA